MFSYFDVIRKINEFGNIKNISNTVVSFFGALSDYDNSFCCDTIIEDDKKNEEYDDINNSKLGNDNYIDNKFRIFYEIHANNNDEIKSIFSIITEKYILELFINNKEQDNFLKFINSINFGATTYYKLEKNYDDSIKFYIDKENSNGEIKCNRDQFYYLDRIPRNSAFCHTDEHRKYIVLSTKTNNFGKSKIVTESVIHLNNNLYKKFNDISDEYINKYESQLNRIEFDKRVDLIEKRKKSIWSFLYF